jgi:hypothetical protein
MNPTSSVRLEPGRRQAYFLPQTYFVEVRKYVEKLCETTEKIFPMEINVHDEIGNVYRGILDEDNRKAILTYMYGNSDGEEIAPIE